MAKVNLTYHAGSRFTPGDLVSVYPTIPTELYRQTNRRPIEPPLGEVTIASDGTIDLTAMALPVTEKGNVLPTSAAPKVKWSKSTTPPPVEKRPISYAAYKETPEGVQDVWQVFTLQDWI